MGGLDITRELHVFGRGAAKLRLRGGAVRITAPTASLDGIIVVNEAGEWPVVHLRNSCAHLQGLDINCADEEGLCGVLVEGGAAPVIDCCRVRGVARGGAGVSFMGEGTAGRLVESHIERGASDGVRVYHGASPSISGCSIVGAGKCGAIFNKGGGGIIERSVISDCQEGIVLEAGSKPLVADNFLRGNRGGDLVQAG